MVDNLIKPSVNYNLQPEMFFPVLSIIAATLAVCATSLEIRGFQKLPGDWAIMQENLSPEKQVELKFALKPKGLYPPNDMFSFMLHS